MLGGGAWGAALACTPGGEGRAAGCWKARSSQKAHLLCPSPQARGWSCTSATGARAALQPRFPCTMGTWRRYCWTPSTSLVGAAPRARTVTGGCALGCRAGGGEEGPRSGWLLSWLGQAGRPGPSSARPVSQGSMAGSGYRGQVLPGPCDTTGPPPLASHAPPGRAGWCPGLAPGEGAQPPLPVGPASPTERPAVRLSFPPSLTPFPQPASLADPARYEQSVRGRQPQHRRKEQLPGGRAGRLQLGSAVVWWSAVCLWAVSGLLGCGWRHPKHLAHRSQRSGAGVGRGGPVPGLAAGGQWGLASAVRSQHDLQAAPSPPPSWLWS